MLRMYGDGTDRTDDCVVIACVDAFDKLHALLEILCLE